MVDVNVSVFGILMCCDESVCGLNLGRGYSITKIKFEDIPGKDKLSDGNGRLIIDYYGSRIIEPDGIYFMCVKKDDCFQINGVRLPEHPAVITDKDIMCTDELSEYSNAEMKYLNEQINLCRLFHDGNIGFRDVFFTYHHNVFGFNNTINNSSHNQTRNVINSRTWHLSATELNHANQWLSDYAGTPYTVLENCINEFSWGLEQIDLATGFEQYTTTLEMVMLETNEQGKKQKLANRTAALIGTNNAQVAAIYQKMITYYRYRSESLHEGNGNNISNIELIELESITRNVLQKSLIRCKMEIAIDSTVSWKEIKDKIINDLVAQVGTLKAVGVLPT